MIGDAGGVAVASGNPDGSDPPVRGLEQVPEAPHGDLPVALVPDRGRAQHLLGAVERVARLGPVGDASGDQRPGPLLELPFGAVGMRLVRPPLPRSEIRRGGASAVIVVSTQIAWGGAKMR